MDRPYQETDMTRRLAAAALVATALSATPASAATCTLATNNPYRPLPSGGGGGEPSTPVPGQPREWVNWYVASAASYVNCLVTPY